MIDREKSVYEDITIETTAGVAFVFKHVKSDEVYDDDDYFSFTDEENNDQTFYKYNIIRIIESLTKAD